MLLEVKGRVIKDEKRTRERNPGEKIPNSEVREACSFQRRSSGTRKADAIEKREAV